MYTQTWIRIISKIFNAIVMLDFFFKKQILWDKIRIPIYCKPYNTSNKRVLHKDKLWY